MNVEMCGYGPDALLLAGEGFSVAAAEQAVRRLAEDGRIDGVREIQGAMGVLLVEFASVEGCRTARRVLEAFFSSRGRGDRHGGRVHRIPVIYDGEDLAEFARRTHCTAEEVIARHTATPYEVQALGFMPGFPYLGPLDARLHLARRASPRVRVPAGSVAIGGGYTGIYPSVSPGGWWLLGRTPTALMDARLAEGEGSAEAFLLRVGDRVIFEPRDA